MNKKGRVWESGFTQIPHIYLQLLPFYIDTKSAVLIVIIEQTFGFHKPCKRMTTSFLKNATGKSSSQIKRALKELEDENLIINYKEKKSVQNVWGLNENYSQWSRYEEVKILLEKFLKYFKEKDTSGNDDELEKIIAELEKGWDG